jgi:hypothetical protein
MLQCTTSHVPCNPCLPSIPIGGHPSIFQRTSLAITSWCMHLGRQRIALASLLAQRQRLALASPHTHRQRIALASPHDHCLVRARGHAYAHFARNAPHINHALTFLCAHVYAAISSRPHPTTRAALVVLQATWSRHTLSHRKMQTAGR